MLTRRFPNDARGFGRRGPASHRCSGTTFVELLIVMSILVFVVGVYYRMLAAGNGMRAINRENAVAVEAARVMVERMHNTDYRELFATYNSDPLDDLGGEGTAPGHRFFVEGITALAEAADGMHGEIIFPSLLVEPEPLEEGPREVQLGVPAPAPIVEPTLQLREDVNMPELGMPRDLNGDSIVDDLDHKNDYIVLPVQVRVQWEGRHGPRSIELFTMFVDYGSVE